MMSFKDFWALCEERRSVRYFEEESVSKEEVLELLEVARIAPSVENTQPWRFHVVINKELREKLMEASCYGNFVAGASIFLVVTCDKMSKPGTQEILWNPKELEYSCVAAIDHLMLAATAKGIGSCWVSLHHGPVHDMLKLQDHQVVIGGIMLGRPKGGELEKSVRHERKDAKDVYTLYE